MSLSPDDVWRRCGQLAEELHADLRRRAHIEHAIGPAEAVMFIQPTSRSALALSWSWSSAGAVVDTGGGSGGRWELQASEEDLALLEDIVRSVIAGRVVEVQAPGRSKVTVTLRDGRRLSETGYEAVTGCLPLPLWTRWGTRIRYEPYL